jgi:hypothetical protein
MPNTAGGISAATARLPDQRCSASADAGPVPPGRLDAGHKNDQPFERSSMCAEASPGVRLGAGAGSVPGDTAERRRFPELIHVKRGIH